MAYDLKGKIVLITGGASGIGYCCVKELLRNNVQAVTIAEIDENRGQEAVKELTTEFGPNKVLFVKTDVTKADQLEAAFKATVGTWKAIDVVINNAGIMNEGQWQLEISLNCAALVQGTLIGLEYMGKDKGGKGGVIINMASTLGLQPYECLPVYCGTKHFVIGFTRSIGAAYHYERTGVKVLAMCPGGTDTNLIPAAVQCPFSPEVGKRFAMIAKAANIQSPENVARSMVTIITKGESGTIWVAEDDKTVYQVHIPDRKEMARSSKN